MISISYLYLVEALTYYC